MIQRLFLDGIDLNRGRCAVAETVKLAAFVYANEAETGLSRPDVAVSGAKVAVNTTFTFRLPPPALVQSFRLLQDFELRHRRPTPSLYADRRGHSVPSFGSLAHASDLLKKKGAPPKRRALEPAGGLFQSPEIQNDTGLDLDIVDNATHGVEGPTRPGRRLRQSKIGYGA